MASMTVTVGSAVGLHARPAAVIAETVEKLGTDIELSLAQGDPVDASSSLLIMTLGAERGDEVTVSGPSPEAVDQIADLVASDLDA